jgi:uncharacterized protein (TIGR03382 family)
MIRRYALPALALGALVTAGTSPAFAFCRAKSCDDEPAYDDVWQEMPDASCVRDKFDCQLEGTPLFWRQSCLSFSVQKDGSPKLKLPYSVVHDAAAKAFATWLAAPCGVDFKKPSFAIADIGPADCAVPQYNDAAPNANVIMFRDSGWDPLDDDVIALTTTMYNTETGEVFDADIELNSTHKVFTTSDLTPAGAYDLQAVLTHEIGHFLGLSHSSNVYATMFMHYKADAQQRHVTEDDSAGICAVYPPGVRVDTNACAPLNGFSPECQTDGDLEQGGCALAAQSRASSAPLAVLASLGLAWLFRRRRR